MSRVDAAAAMDRLPWLADEPSPPAKRGSRGVTGWAVSAIVLVGAASFWIGTETRQPDIAQTGETTARPATIVRLPEPRPVLPEIRVQPQPQVSPVRAPELRPPPVRELRSAPARSFRIHPPQPSEASVAVTTIESPVSEPPRPVAPPPATQTPSASPQILSRPSVAPARLLTPWPPRVTAGAAGRLVQIGSFGTRYQAKRGWWFMARAYPAVRRLPAVVMETRNSRGRHFYRFQIGTTSQAHSEVLCQRMQTIRLSCAVVGLPWKPRGVER